MKSTLFFSAVATLVATALPALCQNQPQPIAMLNVARIQVKLDRVAEFEEIEKQVTGSYKKAAPADQFRIVYRDAVGNPAEFWIFTPLRKFADRDGENPYNKMATEQERATRGARIQQDVDHVQTSIVRAISDLTIRTDGVPFPPTYLRSIRIRVRPGAGQDFVNLAKTDLIPALKKAGDKTVLANQTILGGNTADYNIVVGFEKWAEMDNTTPLPQVMGQEAFQKMIGKLDSLLAGREDIFLRYQPDLSYVAGPGGASSR